MEYLVAGHKYSFSYSELKEDYERFRAMRDEEFLKQAINALHFACFVCFVKEVPSYICLSDVGVIHQLIHLINPSTRETALGELREIREMFNLWCALS